MQPLCSIANRFRSFSCRECFHAVLVIVRNGFWLGTIRADFVLAHKPSVQQQLRSVPIAGSAPCQLIKDVQRSTCRVIVHRIVRPRVRIPAPVHAALDAVKAGNLFIGYFLNAQILKYCRAATDNLAKILMPVCCFVCALQVFSIGHEPLSEPFCGRCFVGGVMYQLSVAGFQRVPICPVSRHCWRVKALERNEPVTAAQAGLLHISDLLFTVKLVKLFKPRNPDVAERHLDRLYLAGVIHAKKKHLLPSRQIGAFHRGYRATKTVVQTKLIDCPYNLRINACAQCVANLAKHSSVALRMLYQLQNQLYAYIAGFCTTAPAFGNKFFHVARLDFAVNFPKTRGNNPG